jgi:glycosyltransferase involved in cell wall biosynthesis
LKILTVVWSIGVGGTERAAVNYAIGYSKYGVDSKVLVLGEDSNRLIDLQQEGVDTFFLQAEQQDVLTMLKNWGPHIIHLHNYTPAYIPYLDKIKARDTKIVETNVFSRPHYDQQYKTISLSMQLSQWGCWKYTKWMKGAAYTPEVTVAPYTVYKEKFTTPTQQQISLFLQSNEIPPGAFVAGRLGQAHPSKWDAQILKVVEQTVKPDNNIYYFFVGMPSIFIKEAKALPAFVQSRIRFIDAIRGDDKLALYYYSLNCFVHMSHIGESFGYVLAEAMMCNVPVVTMLTPYNDNAQFEVVGHNNGGICVTSTSDFAAAVLQLYNYPGEVDTLRKKLNDGWIEKRFSADNVIPAMLETYSRLLEGKKVAVKDTGQLLSNCFDMYGLKKKWMLPFLKLYNSRTVFVLLNRLRKIIK